MPQPTARANDRRAAGPPRSHVFVCLATCGWPLLAGMHVGVEYWASAARSSSRAVTSRPV